MSVQSERRIGSLCRSWAPCGVGFEENLQEASVGVGEASFYIGRDGALRARESKTGVQLKNDSHGFPPPVTTNAFDHIRKAHDAAHLLFLFLYMKVLGRCRHRHAFSSLAPFYLRGDVHHLHLKRRRGSTRHARCPQNNHMQHAIHTYFGV